MLVHAIDDVPACRLAKKGAYMYFLSSVRIECNIAISTNSKMLEL